MYSNGIIYKVVKSTWTRKSPCSRTYRKHGEITEASDTQEDSFLYRVLKPRSENFSQELSHGDLKKNGHEHSKILQKMHGVRTGYVADKKCMGTTMSHLKSTVINELKTNSSGNQAAFISCYQKYKTGCAENNWTHMKAYYEENDYFQLGIQECINNPSFPSLEANGDHQYNPHRNCCCICAGQHDVECYNMPSNRFRDELRWDRHCTNNFLDADCTGCTPRLVSTPLSSGHDNYEPEKDYGSFMDSEFREVLGLDSRLFVDTEFSHFVFMALSIRYLNRGCRNLNNIRFFEPFCSFSPETLITGYVLLHRYTHAFESPSDLAHMYLACCIVSSKVRTDLNLSNINLSRFWDIPVAKVNYFEALLINAIDYDVFVDDEEATSTMFEIKQLCFEFGEPQQQTINKI